LIVRKAEQPSGVGYYPLGEQFRDAADRSSVYAVAPTNWVLGRVQRVREKLERSRSGL